MPHGLAWIDFISDICFPIWGAIVIVILLKGYSKLSRVVDILIYERKRGK